MSGFTERPGISKWETDTIKMRIYDPVYYAQHMIDQKPSLFSSVSYIIDDKRKIFGKILEQYQINCSSYRGAEKTSSGQDMSYWVTYRERLMNDYKEKALNDIRNEVMRLITNCKNILIDYNYDMFEEFKKVYPDMANYFNIKRDDITWYYYDRMPTFIECVIKCVLSIEALNKRNEIIWKYEQKQLKMYQEQQLLLYKKEFECARLFDEIDKNKLKSSEVYVEYKIITEIKDKGLLSDTQFINYFTEDKKKYINGLIELVNNPTPVNNEEKRTVTSGDADADALFKQGEAYSLGEGVVEDYTEAIRFYRLAAKKGHTGANSRLGNMYEWGIVFTPDYVEAARFYRIAAEQGDINAQFDLGNMFRNGKGVAKDEAQAQHFYRLAAAQGHVTARKSLSKTPCQSQGLAQDRLKDSQIRPDPLKNTQKIFQPIEVEDTSINNIVMTVVEIKENNTNTAQVCDKQIQKTQKKGLRKEKDIIRVLNIFTNGNIKKKYFDSGLHKVVLNTPLYDPINEYTKNVNGFWEKHTLGVYLNSLYNKELSEFCLDDKKYCEFMCKSTLIPL
jgi:hypothetical protein